MNFEEARRHWQAQAVDSPSNLATDPAVDLPSRHAAFRRAIAWRDLREVGAATLVAILALSIGFARADWGHFALAAGAVFVGLFLLVDRFRQRRLTPAPDHSTHSFVRSALAQVDHQIWLLRQIHVWYIAPIVLGELAVVASTALGSTASSWVESAILAALIACMTLVLGLVAWGVYRLNQRALRDELEPRRQELLAILGDLEPREPESADSSPASP